MFVEAFHARNVINGWNTLPPSSPFPILRRANPLFSGITTEAVPSTKASIEYIEESQLHIVTLPPFVPTDDQNDGAYPSPLHQIHILPLLTDEETAELLQLARNHATENQSWDRQDSSRHASYPTVDFAIEESCEILQYLGPSGIRFEERVFCALSDAYGVDVEDMSFLDLFCASYEGKESDGKSKSNDSDEDRNTMDRLAFHRDGSLLSFTVLLSPLNEFEGGGTIFDAFLDVVVPYDDAGSVLLSSGVIQPPQAGYVTLHSGKLLHGGHVVSKGQRIVLVGFVDVHERNMRPGALHNATKEWGRNDVRAFWNERRLSLVKQQQRRHQQEDIVQPLWKLKNSRYLPKDTKEGRITNEGRSCIGQKIAIPSNIVQNFEKRADMEKIRRRRLITEDKFLREILLPRDERGEKGTDEDGGEWLEVDMDNMNGLMLGWDTEKVE